MRAVIQRVSSAKVSVDGQMVGSIGAGLMVLLGVEEEDSLKDLQYIFNKTTGLRVFEDQQGKMNLPLSAIGGELLVVSQFTLLGDVRKGKRPSFIKAAQPELANQYYKQFIQMAREGGISVASGIFQADMSVSLVNEGPVTILLDSRKQF
ncbi:MAG: D-aminoacyl-tRNA deacylase [Planctomycetota bacterium]